MRKCPQKKLSAARKNISEQHQARKDNVAALKKNKTAHRKTTVKKVTVISQDSGKVHSRILSPGKGRRKRFGSVDKRTPETVEMQKLMTAYPEESAIFPAIDAQVKNQIEETCIMPPVSETLEQTVAAVERQFRAHVEEMTRFEAALLEEKVTKTAAQESAGACAQQAVQLKEELKTQPEAGKTTGVCDCCGKIDIPDDHLIKIDSGQRLCPNCLGELRGLS
jgi:hypothetical protein